MNNREDLWKHCEVCETPPHLTTPCLEFRNSQGHKPTRRESARHYPRFQAEGERFRTHHLSFILTQGEITEGLHVLHKCDNPWCVEPTHLYLGDNQQNCDDKVERGRTCKGIKHPYRPFKQIRKLSPDTVRQVRLLSETLSQRQVAKQLGVTRSNVRDILAGKTYRDVL